MRENNQAAGKTWTYGYDDGGNIQSKTEYAYTTGSLGAAVRTIPYGYDDASWSDLLTSIGGQSLTADEIGNLLSDGMWAYTWQHGRQLAGMSKSGQTIAYGYDSDGKRITKIVNGTAYNYHYLGDQLVELTWSGNKLHFTYDSTGPLSVNYNGTEYFYVKNAQGDVTGLVNASGTRVVTYTYDAWGNPLTTTGSMAATLGAQNPLRYRGYVYDTETGLYYLQSRYYNPGWGRFINADGYLSTGQGILGSNAFAYCNNNAVNAQDSNGRFLCTIVGALVGAVFGGVTARIEGKTGRAFWASVARGAVSGAVTGFVSDMLIITGGSALVVGVISAVAGGFGNAAGAYTEKKVLAAGSGKKVSYTVGDAITDIAIGTATSIPVAATAAPIVPLMKETVQKAGKKALQKGITFGYAAIKKTKQEFHHLGESIAVEAMSDFISWMSEKAGGFVVAKFD